MRQEHSGKFGTKYPDHKLLPLLAAIARHISPQAPKDISQPSFDRGREEAGEATGYPHSPSASAIYQRINRNKQRKLSWREQLELALNDKPITQKIVAAERREPEPELNERHVFFSLRIVARSLDAPTLTRTAYGAQRDKLIKADRRRRRHGGQLEGRLLTLGQIDRIVRSARKAAASTPQSKLWRDALEIAKLGPPPNPPPPPTTPEGNQYGRGEPILRMLEVWTESNPERLPSERKLREFTKALGLRLGDRNGQPWSHYIDQFLQRRAEQGLPAPAPPQRGKHLNYKLPDVTIEPSAAPGTWAKQECVEAIRRYLVSLPPGKNPSRQHYIENKEPGWPWPSQFDRFGGWAALRDEARRS